MIGKLRYLCDLPARVLLKHKRKMTSDCCVFIFFKHRVDGKHLICFQSETPVSKFLRRVYRKMSIEN